MLLNFARRVLSCSAFFLCLSAGLVQQADGKRLLPDPVVDEYRTKVVATIRSNFDFNRLKDLRKSRIDFEIGPEGQVANAAIARSSGSTQFDFACLEAILGSAPFERPPAGFPRLGIYFTNTQGRSNSPRAAYLRSLAETDTAISVSLIPPGITSKYPTIFKEGASASLQNFRYFKGTKQNDERIMGSLTKFYDLWFKFIKENNTPSHEQISTMAASLEKQFKLERGPAPPLKP